MKEHIKADSTKKTKNDSENEVNTQNDGTKRDVAAGVISCAGTFL
jgi:hypothetical protein